MGIPRFSFGRGNTPPDLPALLLRRFGWSGSGYVAVQPTGDVGPVWRLEDFPHFGSRSGKYPIHGPDQELPGSWVGPAPSMRPVTMDPGYYQAPIIEPRPSIANQINPKPEWMGNTIYDGPLPGSPPDVYQNLNLRPNLTPATLMSLGWQDAQAVISGVPPSRITGAVKRAP